MDTARTEGMWPVKPAPPKTNRSHRPSIRERFGNELEALGVSCFTLYTEDVWQPGRQIPHEVDTRLYYEEPMFSGPLNDLSYLLQDTSELDEDYGLRCAWFPEASKIPTLGTSACHPDYKDDPELFPLFGSFNEREAIRSAALFQPVKSMICLREAKTTPSVVELLFFNYRAPQSFLDPAYKGRLRRLAFQIFSTLSAEIQYRVRHEWQGSMLMNLRTQSRISQIVRATFLATDTLESPAGQQGPDTDEFGRHAAFDRLAEELRSELKVGDEKMIVSIYEHVSRPVRLDSPWRVVDDPQPRLVCRGWAGRGALATELNQQKLYVPEQASITVCTAVTGRSHLLQYVEEDSRHDGMDRPRRTAITIPEPADWRVLHIAEMSAIAGCHRTSASAKIYPCAASASGDRLVLEGTLSDEGWDELSRYVASRGVSPFFVEKWKRRAVSKYARIFGKLDQNWAYPCSEACIPIVVGNQVLGCVNIESNKPDRFNHSFLNALMALASTVGFAIVQTRMQRLLDEMQATASAFHRPLAPSEPANKVSPLDQLAAVAAHAIGCTRLDIVGTLRSATGEPYHHLAVSDPEWHEHNGWVAPRRSSEGPPGWSEYVAKSQTPGLRGVVLVPGHHTGHGPKLQGAYEITGPHEREGRPFFDLSRLAPEGCPTLSHAMALTSPAMIIGIRLTASEVSQSQLPAVMWCMYQYKPFEATANNRNLPVREVEKQQRHLGHVLTIARSCALIPTIARSATLARAEATLNVDHSPLTHSVEYVASWVRDAVESAGDADQDWKTGLRLASAALRAHLIEQRIARRLSEQAPDDLARGLCIEYPDLALRNLLLDAWESAFATRGIPVSGKLDIGGSGPLLSTPCVLLENDALLFVFVQLFRNVVDALRDREGRGAQTHGPWATVRVRAEPQGLRVTVTDRGPGFPPEVIERYQALSARRSIGFRGGEHGRGMDMVFQILSACSLQRPRIENTNGGAQWDLWLPISQEKLDAAS